MTDRAPDRPPWVGWDLTLPKQPFPTRRPPDQRLDELAPIADVLACGQVVELGDALAGETQRADALRLATPIPTTTAEWPPRFHVKG